MRKKDWFGRKEGRKIGLVRGKNKEGRLVWQEGRKEGRKIGSVRRMEGWMEDWFDKKEGKKKRSLVW